MEAPSALCPKHVLTWLIARSFDLDLPLECDDEYWTHPDPEQAFKQPPGKPSAITFFNCYIRLHQILAFALRTIVSWSNVVVGWSDKGLTSCGWRSHCIR